MIQYTIYDSRTLLGIMRDIPPANDYWLKLCFGREVQFQSTYVDFSKLSSTRNLAPLVTPLAQGKPVYRDQETVSRIKPAYLKAKDPVADVEMLSRQPGQIAAAPTLDPQKNYDARVGNIVRKHKDSMERRWEVMAARSIIDGKILLESEDYPARLVDFGRDAEQTVILTGGARWGQPGVNIVKMIEDWQFTARNKPFGGPLNRITMGTLAWEVFRNDPGVLKTLNTLTRGTTSNVKVLDPNNGFTVEYMGLLGALEVYVYRDFYHDDDGNPMQIMAPTDVVLTGPTIDGVRAFGAIADRKASFNPLSIFTKMWDEEDPSVTYIMSQSAPLMVPVNPNNTFKATVCSALIP